MARLVAWGDLKNIDFSVTPPKYPVPGDGVGNADPMGEGPWDRIRTFASQNENIENCICALSTHPLENRRERVRFGDFLASREATLKRV